MKSAKRTKEIKIRLTEQEHQNLLDRKKGELAVWIRNTCLEQEVPQSKIVKTADPELLRQLAKIGGNLNQIAKTTNTEQARGDIINLLRVTAELATIREQLDELLERHR
ncbi:plasmid mobilization protein [Moraxella bovis]|uniref:plasmid mobilization protein n=1 Tax=Moraxella bovis TaxID=476 RepID=UPI00227B2F3D|nr:plasmid mobilization relaxosome protein MobC [Moraxella bovis]WAJ74967.1 MobC family plasmid mobilization relaxosome protein [Moraxella bovis]